MKFVTGSKYWILAIFILFLITGFVRMGTSLFASTSRAAWLQEIPGTSYFAAFPVAITLDGSFDDWENVPYAEVLDGPQPAPTPQDGSMRFAVVADNHNLYFSVQVMDSNIVAGKHGVEYWYEDSVEIYINATGDSSLTSYVPGVAQINIPAANIGLPSDQAIISGFNYDTLNVRAVVVATDEGYAVEAAVPLVTDVWNIVPSNGSTLGFQIQLNGATVLDRDIKLSWSTLDKIEDLSHTNPSVFGQLVFSQVGSAVATLIPSAQPSDAETEMSSTAFSEPTNFTVRGADIYDPGGNLFVAKGVNVNGYNWVWRRKTVSDIDQIVNCWRFNLIRVNSFLFTHESQYEQYSDNNNLNEIVNAFTSRGIVVVMEAHDRIGSYYQGNDLTLLVSWFTALANQYKDNPYVWFDVMNEPGGRYVVDSANWLQVHGQVIQAIRNAGAENIIIVEGAHGGQDTGGWSNQLVADTDSAILSLSDELLNFGGQNYDNIVFSIHPYDQWNFGDAKLADYFDRVRERNLAMIVGEYGVQTNVDTSAAAESVFNVTIPRQIGRIVWHWDGGDDNDLTVNTSQGGGWELNDCTNPTNLSWLGQKVWDDNHSPTS